MTIRTRQELIDSINTLLADNSSQQISPLDVRSVAIDIIDSTENLLTTVEVNAINMSTPNDRSVRIGVGALDKLDLVGRSSADNVAIGYRSLYQNYDGVDNTVIGSQAASCNLYGDHLVAIGKNALAGNISGSGSVAIGNFAGQGLKTGNFNIFIGHGAGNYVPVDQDYRLYIGAHAVNYTDLCDSSSASGNAPTLYGDLQNHRIAIGVGSLHDFGVLQSSGDITPVTNHVSNLGHGSRAWQQLYLTSGINYPSSGSLIINSYAPKGGGFPDQYDITPRLYMTGGGQIGIGTTTPSGAQGILTVAGNIVPDLNGIRRLGTSGLLWDVYCNDLFASGSVTVNDLNYTSRTDYLYEPMTIHLAVSGTGDPLSSGFVNSSVYGFLSDSQLVGAGFILHAAGPGYQRDYQWIFQEPNQSLVCLEEDTNYARASWKSNISIELDDGLHVETQRVLGDHKVSLVTQSGCQGVFLRTEVANGNDYLYFGSEDHVGAYSSRKNVNFYANYGDSNHFVGIHTIDSGVTLGLDFASHAGTNSPSGFSLEYVNRLAGDDTFVIKRNASSIDVLTVTESGFVGVSNWDNIAVMPQTNFHVRTKGYAEARISSNGSNNAVLRAERINNKRGFNVTYNPTDDMIDLIAQSGSDARDYDQYAFMTVDPDTRYVTVGQIYNEVSSNRPFNGVAPFAVYHNGVDDSGTMALREQDDIPSASAGWGKIYVKPNVQTGQTQSIYFVDDGGNIFDLTQGTAGGGDGLHYTSPGTTIVGSGSFANISTTRWNTAVGSEVFVSGTSMSSGVVLGYHNAQYATNVSTGVILLGTSLYRNISIPNYTLAIGHGTSPLVTGNTSSREFWISNGELGVTAANDAVEFSIDHSISAQTDTFYDTVFTHKDTVNAASVSGRMLFDFTDSSNNSNTLVTLDHRSPAMSNSVLFSGGNPYMRIDGDLKLRGSIQFSDGTYFESALGVLTYAGSGLRRREVSYGALIELDFSNLNTITEDYADRLSNVFIAVNDGAGFAHSYKMSLSEVTEFINSGSAFVAANCNHIFLDDNANFNTALNSGNVVIGCDAGHSATGWKHGVMIGTEAGSGATTPNNLFATDTAPIFIGMRAGKDADNVSNLIAIGTNAGNEARNAEGSIFIGPNAGNDIQCNDSIGIGENALRGTEGGGAGGAGNIEIVASMLDSERLMYQRGHLSNRLNIQNAIAGDMDKRRVSIGDAVLAPDAPLSVRKDVQIPGHSGTDYIQTWYCNDELVAGVNCEGEFVNFDEPDIIEGYSTAVISCPSGYNTPASGIILERGSDFISTTERYVTHRDHTRTIGSGVLVIAHRINGEYRPIYIGCSGV